MTLLLILFIIGYCCIAFEGALRINKSATALLTGGLCWAVLFIVSGETKLETLGGALEFHLSEIAGILFFLLGAMTIVELIDAHHGFAIVTQRLRTRKKQQLLWTIGLLSFFLSAVLDNLTTAIVMTSLLRKLVSDRNDRLILCGLVVIAANAGGAWTPIGDVTTTMLWTGGQITSLNIMTKLLLPSLVCLLLPLIWMSFRFRGTIEAPTDSADFLKSEVSSSERNLVFFVGLAALIGVPVLKQLLHLPPFLGVMLGLGVLWLVTELIHRKKDEEGKGGLTVAGALQRIDTPSILFFLGILLAVAALQSGGLLRGLADTLDRSLHDVSSISLSIGGLSSIIDNVPLVAAAQGMYPVADAHTLTPYVQDGYFWEFLAYCAGTGGSLLIIGSAAGVAVMGLEKIDFFWYLKKISFPALLGYLGGAGVYMLLQHIL